MTRLVKFGKSSKVLLAVILLTASSVVAAATDATEVPPSPITNTSVQTPSATVLAPTVNTATLATCPATISNCPDINGQGGSQTTCPDNCKVTRTSTNNPSYTPAMAGFIPAVSQVTNVTCPVGYFPGQTFDPQPEYVYMSPPTKSPVSLAAYNALGGTGCSATGTTVATQGAPDINGNCGLSPGQSCCNYGNPCSSKVGNGVVYDSSTACSTVSLPNYPNGRNTIDTQTGAFYITSQNYSWTNCGGSCAGGCIQGTWLSTDNYNYTITKVACTPQPGFYPSGNTVNASTVCTRSKTHWKQLNQ